MYMYLLPPKKYQYIELSRRLNSEEKLHVINIKC